MSAKRLEILGVSICTTKCFLKSKPNSEKRMTPTEDATFKRRYNRLIKEGLADEEATDLCYQLMIRDREDLDMAVCLECKYLNKTYCQKFNRYTPRFVMMRCDRFERRV